MNVKIYTQAEFKKIYPKYEEMFHTELMPIDMILKLPSWGGRIKYALMVINSKIAGFARIQQVPGLGTRDIQDLFIFSEFRGRRLCAPFICAIMKSHTGKYCASIEAQNTASRACFESCGFTITDDKILKSAFDQFWALYYKNKSWVHYSMIKK